MKCEIFIFENQNWNEIPENKNPAVINKNNKDFYGVLICKVLPYECGVTGKEGYIVCDISTRFVACRRLGVFWQLSNAQLFATIFAEKVRNSNLMSSHFHNVSFGDNIF